MVRADGEPLLQGAIVPQTTKMNPFYFGSFNVTKTFADQNPDAVRHISLALDEAIEFVKQNPKEACKMMENYLPKEQHGLIVHFPNSLFKNTNDTRQEDLNVVLDYYKRERTLTANLDLSGAQYRRP